MESWFPSGTSALKCPGAPTKPASRSSAPWNRELRRPVPLGHSWRDRLPAGARSAPRLLGASHDERPSGKRGFCCITEAAISSTRAQSEDSECRSTAARMRSTSETTRVSPSSHLFHIRTTAVSPSSRLSHIKTKYSPSGRSEIYLVNHLASLLWRERFAGGCSLTRRATSYRIMLTSGHRRRGNSDYRVESPVALEQPIGKRAG